MLTGLKVSSVAWKCVFSRSELTGKWGAHGTEIKFLKFKSEMYQRIELKSSKCTWEKWGHSSSYVYSYFNYQSYGQMSKMVHFMYFLLDTAKNQSQFGEDI